MQDAAHVVEVVADDRETRMLRLDHDRQELPRRRIGLDADELRPRNHHVARVHVGDGDRAEQDVQHVDVDQVAVGRVPQRFHQLRA